jgi:hypothetical protein
MPLLHEDYFEVIILGKSRHRRNSDNRAENPFVRESNIYRGNTH